MNTKDDDLLHEEAPDAPGAEDWIKKHKSEFKRRYGANWARVLYGKAWLLYGKNATNRDEHRAKNETTSHMTVVISGPVGCGKSAVARVIQQTLAGGGLDVQFDRKDEAGDAEDAGDLKDVSAKKVVLATQYDKKPETVTEAASSFVPPKEVQEAARRGLELRKKHGRGGWDSRKARENGIGSGVVRAQTLVAGKGVSLDTVRRMRSFFQRHDGEQERAARQRDETSAANIAWLLWGGDAGRKWAAEVLKDA